MTVKTLIIRTAGTNCDLETRFAFERAGSDASLFHINRVSERPSLLDEHQILALPGGFSYGDDIASGKILANELLTRLADPLKKFVDDGKLILGICNGFQVLVKTGLLPGPFSRDVPQRLGRRHRRHLRRDRARPGPHAPSRAASAPRPASPLDARGPQARRRRDADVPKRGGVFRVGSAGKRRPHQSAPLLDRRMPPLHLFGRDAEPFLKHAADAVADDEEALLEQTAHRVRGALPGFDRRGNMNHGVRQCGDR